MSSKSSVKVMPDAAEPMEAEQRAAIRKIGREYWDSQQFQNQTRAQNT